MVPAKTDARWKALLTGEEDLGFQSLSSKLLVAQLRRMLKEDPSPEGLEDAIDVAHAFFTKNEPVVRDDVERLLKEQG